MNSSFPNIVLSKDIFCNCGWEEVVNNCSKKDCFNYYQGFRNKAQKFEHNNNQFYTALELLAQITWPELKNPDDDSPFFYMDFINNISNEHLEILKNWISDISDAELKARIGDIVFIRTQNYKIVVDIINSYLESANCLEDSENWPLSIKRIRRAFYLAKKTNYLAKKTNQKTLQNKIINQIENKIINQIENILDKYNGEDNGFLSAKLMEILLLLEKFNKNNLDLYKYADFAEKAADRFQSQHYWDKARYYWNIAIDWHNKKQNNDRKRSAFVSLAETYIKESEDKINEIPPNYIAVFCCLKTAIKIFKEIGNSGNRIEEIHRMLLDYQTKFITEFKPSFQEIEINIDDIVKEVKSRLEGKQLNEAIYTLAFICKPPSKNYIKQQTEKNIQENPFEILFSYVTVNKMGKEIGNNPSLEEKMYENASCCQQFLASFIQIAIKQILSEHSVKISDFCAIVTNNPFVPKGREKIYARGLHAGLTGDFLIAAHLLIPQIEHSLRCLLSERNIITSWIDDKNIQDEYIMSKIFKDHITDLDAIFGEDITFNLIGVLNRKGYGANLRNLVAHGFMDIEDFDELSVVYLWWLTLHLCYLDIKPENKSTQINEQE